MCPQATGTAELWRRMSALHKLTARAVKLAVYQCTDTREIRALPSMPHKDYTASSRHLLCQLMHRAMQAYQPQQEDRKFVQHFFLCPALLFMHADPPTPFPRDSTHLEMHSCRGEVPSIALPSSPLFGAGHQTRCTGKDMGLRQYELDRQLTADLLQD